MIFSPNEYGFDSWYGTAGGESGTGNLATIGAYPLPSLTDSLTDSLADQTKAIGDSEEAKVVASNENNDSSKGNPKFICFYLIIVFFYLNLIQLWKQKQSGSIQNEQRRHRFLVLTDLIAIKTHQLAV